MGSASRVPDPRELQAATHLHVSALLTDMTIVSLAGVTMVLAAMLAASGQSHDPRAHLPTVGWAAATAAPSAPCFRPPRMNVLGNGYAPIPVAALLLPFFPISLIFCCSSDTACSADSSSTISSLLKVFVCLAASLEQLGAGSHFYLDS